MTIKTVVCVPVAIKSFGCLTQSCSQGRQQTWRDLLEWSSCRRVTHGCLSRLHPFTLVYMKPWKLLKKMQHSWQQRILCVRALRRLWKTAEQQVMIVCFRVKKMQLNQDFMRRATLGHCLRSRQVCSQTLHIWNRLLWLVGNTEHQ